MVLTWALETAFSAPEMTVESILKQGSVTWDDLTYRGETRFEHVAYSIHSLLD